MFAARTRRAAGNRITVALIVAAAIEAGAELVQVPAKADHQPRNFVVPLDRATPGRARAATVAVDDDVCLIGFQNRLLVLLRWTISFLTRGRGARLILEPATEERTTPTPFAEAR